MPSEKNSSIPKHLQIMQQGVSCPVKVISSDKEKIGEVRIKTFNQKERIVRGLKFLGIFWGSAIFAVFIPMLHFILVPLLFLVGIIVAVFVSQTKSVVLGGESACPKCESFLPIVRSSDQWPLSDLCSHCRTTVTISKID